MESTLSASSTLGAIGSLAKPARKTRRSQNTGTLTGSQGISSAGQSISSRTTPGAQSTSRGYAREAIVEAMSDAALVELVLAIDQLRRRRFLALPLEDVPFLDWVVDVGTSPEQSALEGEQQDEVQTYLQRLPGKYRAVIVLRYWYDFSYEEIARTLNLTPALVKARLHRARELLARYMKQNSVNEEEQTDALPRR